MDEIKKTSEKESGDLPEEAAVEAPVKVSKNAFASDIEAEPKHKLVLDLKPLLEPDEEILWAEKYTIHRNSTQKIKMVVVGVVIVIVYVLTSSAFHAGTFSIFSILIELVFAIFAIRFVVQYFVAQNQLIRPRLAVLTNLRALEYNGRSIDTIVWYSSDEFRYIRFIPNDNDGAVFFRSDSEGFHTGFRGVPNVKRAAEILLEISARKTHKSD